jgi:hypothetical protein
MAAARAGSGVNRRSLVPFARLGAAPMILFTMVVLPGAPGGPVANVRGLARIQPAPSLHRLVAA